MSTKIDQVQRDNIPVGVLVKPKCRVILIVGIG